MSAEGFYTGWVVKFVLLPLKAIDHNSTKGKVGHDLSPIMPRDASFSDRGCTSSSLASIIYTRCSAISLTTLPSRNSHSIYSSFDIVAQVKSVLEFFFFVLKSTYFISNNLYKLR